MKTENISTLKIHKLTQAQYERELAAGTLDANALYLTPEEEIDLSGYATIKQLNGKADTEHTHDNYLSTTGTAAKATADASGNVITTTYATKAEVPEVVEAAISSIDNLVYIGTSDAEDTTSGATSLVDADTLGGYNASYFATQEDLTNIVNGTTTVAKATTADSATSATSATKATQDGSGNTITSTYATKSQLGTQVTYSLSGTTLTITTK